jgi:hypothetical protein
VGSLRGGPTEADRRLARFRRHIGSESCLTDAQLEVLIGQLYALANVAVDAYWEQRSHAGEVVAEGTLLSSEAEQMATLQ